MEWTGQLLTEFEAYRQEAMQLNIFETYFRMIVLLQC